MAEDMTPPGPRGLWPARHRLLSQLIHPGRVSSRTGRHAVTHAMQAVAAVHDEGADALDDVLADATPQDVRALVVGLAALVDPDRPLTAALAWLDQPLPAHPTRSRSTERQSSIDDELSAAIYVAGLEDRMSVAQVRAAHARWNAGHKNDPVAALGERAYQRARQRLTQARRRSAARQEPSHGQVAS